MKIQINKDRLVNEFIELASVDSVTYKERAAADLLTGKLKVLGFKVYEDNAAEHYGGSAGNIYGYLPGDPDREAILFSAHMDTVEPSIGKRPILHEDGRITSDGKTVLGADDVSGLVEILEGIRSVKGSGCAHGDVEVLFSIGEEAYLKGTNVFDFDRIKAHTAYVLDLSGDVGSAANKAPTLISFEVTVTGKAAHAGFSPESGVNAIAAAADAIARIRQGHIDGETTCNIGTVTGGVATNIISEQCVCTGEIRSLTHSKALAQLENIKAAFKEAAEAYGAEYRLVSNTDLTAYSIDEQEPVIRRFKKSCAELGLSGTLQHTYGGSDNHNFVANGINGIVLSCGMYDVHSVNEYTKTEELKKGAELVAQLLVTDI